MSASDTTFLSTLAAEVERSRDNLHLDNYDVYQLGPYRGEQHREDLVGPKIERLGDTAPRELATRLSRFADVGFLHGILCDQESRDLLVKLFAYRTLGYRKVKLPRNTEQYWDDIQSLRATATTSPPIPIAWMDARLARYDLASASPSTLRSTAAPPVSPVPSCRSNTSIATAAWSAKPSRATSRSTAARAGATPRSTSRTRSVRRGACSRSSSSRATWRCCAKTWTRTCRSRGASTSSKTRSG